MLDCDRSLRARHRWQSLVHPIPSTQGVTSNASSIFLWSEFLVCLRFACVWHLMLSSALTNIPALRTMCLPTLSLTVITPTCMSFDGVRACMRACVCARSCVCVCVCMYCAVVVAPRSRRMLLAYALVLLDHLHRPSSCCSPGHSPCTARRDTQHLLLIRALSTCAHHMLLTIACAA